MRAALPRHQSAGLQMLQHPGSNDVAVIAAWPACCAWTAYIELHVYVTVPGGGGAAVCN